MKELTSLDSSLNHKTGINVLPDECLSLVLKFIECRVDQDAFGLTCQRWLKIHRESRRSIKISCFDSPEAAQVSCAYLQKIFNSFPRVESLSLSGCTKLPDSALSVFQFAGMHLQNLVLDCCFTITNTGFSYIAHSCPSLSYLSLYRCNINDHVLQHIAQGCPKLKVINLSYCQNLSDRGIAFLCQACPSLSVVNISNCIDIQGQGFEKCSSMKFLEAEGCRFTDDGFCEALKSHSLQYLNLSHLKNGARLGRRGFQCIGFCCYNLQFLYLRMCRSLENMAVIEISRGCPLLKEWNMAVCPQVSAAGWQAVAVNCKNLEILHANRCRQFCSQSMLFIRDGCPKLRCFYIHGCSNLTDLAMELFKQARSTVSIISWERLPEAPYVDNFLNM